MTDGIGYFQPDGRLAGNDLDHAHGDHRQAACQVLGQVGDLGGLHTGGGLQLEARDDRPRVHLDHVDLDPEIRQFQFDLARQGFQHLGAVSRFLLGRIIQQVQRRQFSGRQVLEQGALLFLLSPFAGLALGRHDLRLDLGLGLALLAHRICLANFTALRLGPPSCEPIGQAGSGRADPGNGIECEFPGDVHDPEPRNTGEQRQANQQK